MPTPDDIRAVENQYCFRVCGRSKQHIYADLDVAIKAAKTELWADGRVFRHECDADNFDIDLYPGAIVFSEPRSQSEQIKALITIKHPSSDDIRAARALAKLSQGQAAKLALVSRSGWIKFEHGTRQIPDAVWALFRLRAGLIKLSDIK